MQTDNTTTYNYWCSNRTFKKTNEDGSWELCARDCDICDAKGNFSLNEKIDDDNENELSCPHAEGEIKLMGEKMLSYNFAKLSKEEIKQDRKQRSTEHFKKEIFPTLPKDEQRHFTKKYTDLKPTISLKPKQKKKLY